MLFLAILAILRSCALNCVSALESEPSLNILQERVGIIPKTGLRSVNTLVEIFYDRLVESRSKARKQVKWAIKWMKGSMLLSP